MTELSEIVKKRAARLAAEIDEISVDEIREIAAGVTYQPKSFRNAIMGEELSLVAEIKKNSDSGMIHLKLFEPVELQKELEKSGVSAFSVVTEKDCYDGCAGHLRAIRRTCSLPILRRDYIISPYQLYESRVIGADAVLLIAELHDNATLGKYISLAQRIGLECVVEVHSQSELRNAIEAGAETVNIYLRSLHSIEAAADRISEIRELIPPSVAVMLEGGISNPSDISTARQLGFNAVMLGDYLMSSNDLEQTMRWLKSGLQ